MNVYVMDLMHSMRFFDVAMFHERVFERLSAGSNGNDRLIQFFLKKIIGNK